jgi:hypothetical protein
MLWRVLMLIALILPASPAWWMGGPVGIDAGVCAPQSRASCCEEACCCTSDQPPTAASDDAGCCCAVRQAPARSPERAPEPRGTGLRTGPWLALLRTVRIELVDVLPSPMARGLPRPANHAVAGAPNDVRRERISIWLT